MRWPQLPHQLGQSAAILSHIDPCYSYWILLITYEQTINETPISKWCNSLGAHVFTSSPTRSARPPYRQFDHEFTSISVLLLLRSGAGLWNLKRGGWGSSWSCTRRPRSTQESSGRCPAATLCFFSLYQAHDRRLGVSKMLRSQADIVLPWYLSTVVLASLWREILVSG